MKVNVYIVNSFTYKNKGGNPAGVVIDSSGLSDKQMKLVAKKVNLSETAFVTKLDKGLDYKTRFFTPTSEVDLCGHATIATAYLLKKKKIIDSKTKEVIQDTKAGSLKIKYIDSNTILMQQAKPKKINKDISINKISQSLNINEKHIGIKNMKKPEIWTTGLKDILVPINSLDILRKLKPNFGLISDLSKKLKVVGIHAFYIENKNKIWTRNFAPAFGINEESATGTSNGALGGCLFNKLNIKNKYEFSSFQGHFMNKPSEIKVLVRKNDLNLDIFVGGKSKIIKSKEIVI
ncbi:MAG: PhzF family phenazine biosynthesis protein [Bacillota bacterium]